MKIVYVGSLGTPRLRVRRIYEDTFAESLARAAIEKNDWQIDVAHGGDVCNSYGYPAKTECALVVADPNGCTVCWLGRAPANKVTYRGAAEACLAGSGDIFDGRVKRQARIDATWDRLKHEHARYFSALEQLGAVA
jgi:hypothetical protein